ncbi:hypothetical protein HDC90_001117 [Pedobacter sp. AK013]|nr:hypothetical protein [Pedobacter sp. AK013]
MTDIFIGIDPDVDKSGMAVWDKQTYQELCCLSLWDMFTALSAYHASYSVLVRLEAGWKAKGLNWHTKGGNGAANDVGRNHEIGRQIEKYCIANNIPYVLVLPQGYSSYNHTKFCAITGWPSSSRTNSETRVAGMMVFGCV